MSVSNSPNKTSAIVTADKVTLRVVDGNESSFADVYFHGAHVSEWGEAGASPILFLSKDAILDGSKSIRGGVPIIFPQFGPLGPIQHHGFARNLEWSLSGCSVSPDGKSASVTLQVGHTETSFKEWGNEFTCFYTVTLIGAKDSRLVSKMVVKNLNKEQSFDFSVALHTYFAVGDIDQTTVEGESEEKNSIVGVKYIDKVADGKELVQSDPAITFTGETDRMYLNFPDHSVVVDGAQKRKIHIIKTNLPDGVVWNPWIEKSKTMKDFDNEEYKKMVCVEAADLGITKKNTLASGERWEGTLEMFVSKL